MKIRASTSVNVGQETLHWRTILRQWNDFKGASINWWCILGLLCICFSVLLSLSVLGEVVAFLGALDMETLQRFWELVRDSGDSAWPRRKA